MPPLSPEKFEELREKSKTKILAAALELFAGKGYNATSIESIAQKAGVSKGLIYNYFESKKSILHAIFEDAISMGVDMILRHDNVADPYKRLRLIIEDVFEMVESKPEYLKLFSALSLQPGVMADTKGITAKMHKMNSQFSKYMPDQGRDPINNLILDALIDGVTINYLRYGKKYPIAQLKERIIKDYCTPKKKNK